MATWRSIVILFLVTTTAALSPTIAAEKPARIAIIIDDLGYQLAAGERAVRLPGPIACAVLPLTPRAEHLAEQAWRQGKEVLLHLPLEAQSTSLLPEPGGLQLDMSREQFGRTFDEAFYAVPHAIGINSHRGSLLTRHPGHMRWLMEEIRERGGLFFVDSFTTHESVALRLADESGVPAIRRDVFLDNDRKPAAIRKQFERLKRMARTRGLAVGIGHPYPETLALLEEELPQLDHQGIELINLSRLVSLQVEKKIAASAQAAGE